MALITQAIEDRLKEIEDTVEYLEEKLALLEEALAPVVRQRRGHDDSEVLMEE
jgi:predicted DNA-binding protein YlxM (UPF0122 family)